MTTGHTAPTPHRSRIASAMAKARVLTEAMPYIRQFAGKAVVIKYGGSAMVDDMLRSSFARDITLLGLLGLRPVVVHGGGPHISRAMAQAGIEPRWVDGLRVTDEATLRVVLETLGDKINPDIVRLLGAHGAAASGFQDLGSGLLVARQLDPDLGFVGQIEEVHTDPILELLEKEVVPVLAPLARGADGNQYNINADTAAGALAAALEAQKLIYLTDVEGLYSDLDDENSLIDAIFVDDLRQLLESGSVSAGMLPKLRSCLGALEQGVPRAHILDGRIQHTVLLEVFTPEGIGTMITRDKRW